MKKVLSQMPSMQNGIPHSTLKSNSRHKVQPESFSPIPAPNPTLDTQI